MTTPISVRLVDSNQNITLSLDEEDLADDSRFKAAIMTQLSPFYPDIAHADIRRETTNDSTSASITKRAGTKGTPADVLAALIALPEEINAAQTLAWELMLLDTRNLLTLEAILERQPQIAHAIADGEAAQEGYARSVKALKSCSSTPATIVQMGF